MATTYKKVSLKFPIRDVESLKLLCQELDCTMQDIFTFKIQELLRRELPHQYKNHIQRKSL